MRVVFAIRNRRTGDDEACALRVRWLWELEWRCVALKTTKGNLRSISPANLPVCVRGPACQLEARISIMRAMETFCSQCNTPITCMPEGGCWCAELPNSLPVPEDKTEGCLCRECLTKKLENLR